LTILTHQDNNSVMTESVELPVEREGNIALQEGWMWAAMILPHTGHTEQGACSGVGT